MPRCQYCGVIIEKIETEEKYQCQSCGEFFDQDDLTKIYECPLCGEEFSREDSYDGDSHRCPSCAKFGQVLIEEACPECLEETIEVNTWECKECGEINVIGATIDETKIWRIPYKRGQYFLPKVQGERLKFATLYDIDRERKKVELQIYTKYINKDGSISWPTSFDLNSYITLDELEKNWRAITEQEFKEWFKNAQRAI